MAPKDIARSYPKRGLTADLGFRSEPAFVGDGAATFPTASDYAQTAASADLALGDTYTVCAWVRHATSSSSTAMSILSSGSAEMTLSFFAGSNPALYVFNGSANMNTTGVFTIDLHTWYHVAIVIKSGGGNSQIFINGIDRTASHSLSFTASGTPNINLGGYLTGGWQGDLANVALFTSSLTEDQVRQAMRASDYASHAAIATLEAFYPLSADFNDSTGNHNATASGSPEFRPNRPQLPRGLDLARGAAQARVYTGRAVDFDGSSDFATATTYDGGGTETTMVYWFKANILTAGTIMPFANGGASNSRNQLQTLITGSTLRAADAPTNIPFSIDANRWYMLAIVGDSGGLKKAYLDGIDGGSPVPYGHSFTVAKLVIGARNNTPIQLFNGKIAGFKIFDVELTQAQIRELYHNPEMVIPTGVSASNLRRYYPLSDYNDTGGTGGRYFQDMGADGEPLEDIGSCSMAFAQPVPCPQLGLQQSATRVYFENNATRAEATLGAAPGSTCTMSAWVMVEDTTNYQYIFTQGTSLAATAWFGIAKNNSDNKLYTLQGSAIAAESSLQLSGYGEWNHVVVMTKSTAPYVRIFINGAEDTSINDISMAAYNLTSTSVSIGGNPVYANHMQGFLNDCAIWDVELSDPEVASLYNSGVQGMDVSTVQSANLKGWWKCDDLTSFKDYSGNGANATLTGSVVAASFPENASGSTIVGDFSMKRKGVSILNINNDQGYAYALGQDKPSYFPKAGATGYSMSAAHRSIKVGVFEILWANDNYTGTPANDQFALAMQTNGAYTWSLGDGSSRPQVSTPAGIADGEWHILTLTIDYSVSPARWTTYVDGIQSTTGTASISGPPGNLYNVSFGKWQSGGFKGASALGCFKFYDVALSADEVKRLAFSDLRLIKGLANE